MEDFNIDNENEGSDGWSCWDDDPIISHKLIIPVSNEFVQMLENHEDELVACYRAVGPVYSTPKAESAVIKGSALMRKRDHLIVEALVAELDPELLELARSHFIPDRAGDIFDMTLEQNQLRLAFLNCFEPQENVGKNYKSDFVYSHPYTIVANEVVVISDQVLDHMEYVAANYHKCLWDFFIQARSQHRESENTKELKELLRVYRSSRRVSKSLNKFTKVSQLCAVDYDNPFFWFNLDGEDLSAEDIVLMGPMPSQVLSRYSGSVYDPGMKGKYHDKVILANVVSGDESGVYSVNVRLLSKLYVQCSECVIYCHTVPVDFQPPLRVVRKPRPHNLTAIVRLGEYDYSLRGRFRKQFNEANNKRNDRYYDQWTHVDLLKQYATVDYVVDRAGKGDVLEVDNPKKKKIHRTRQYETRDRLLEQYSRDKGYKFDHTRAVALSGKAQCGYLVRDIPNWGDAGLVMNSLHRRAVEGGFVVVFDGKVWCVV